MDKVAGKPNRKGGLLDALSEREGKASQGKASPGILRKNTLFNPGGGGGGKVGKLLDMVGGGKGEASAGLMFGVAPPQPKDELGFLPLEQRPYMIAILTMIANSFIITISPECESEAMDCKFIMSALKFSLRLLPNMS
jgi:hypothetical protein